MNTIQPALCHFILMIAFPLVSNISSHMSEASSERPLPSIFLPPCCSWPLGCSVGRLRLSLQLFHSLSKFLPPDSSSLYPAPSSKTASTFLGICYSSTPTAWYQFSVLGCFSCFNKIPYTGWLINNRHLFLTVGRLEVHDQGGSMVRWGPSSQMQISGCVPICWEGWASSLGPLWDLSLSGKGVKYWNKRKIEWSVVLD